MPRLSAAPAATSVVPASRAREQMIRLVLAAAMSAYGLAASDVLAGTEQGNGEAAAKDVTKEPGYLSPQQIEAEMKKLAGIYHVRAPAHAKLQKARIDMSGLMVIRDWRQHEVLEVRRRAEALFEQHKEGFIPELYEPYRNKQIKARNLSVPVWMWDKAIERSFSHPPHFRKFEGWCPAEIAHFYTRQFKPHRRLEEAVGNDQWQQAAQDYAQERLRAAAEYYVGMDDAKAKMEEDALAIRTMFEEWAIVDDEYRTRVYKDSKLIPIPNDEKNGAQKERKKQSSLTPRERLSLVLSAHMDERRSVTPGSADTILTAR